MRQAFSDTLVFCVLAAAIVGGFAAALAGVPLAPRVTAVEGRVALVRGNSTRTLKLGDELVAGDTLVAGGGQARLLFPHQDTFDLYPHSVITIRDAGRRRAEFEQWITAFKDRVLAFAGHENNAAQAPRQRWSLYSGDGNPAHVDLIAR